MTRKLTSVSSRHVSRAIKRGMDIVMSASALIATLPFMTVSATLIWLLMGTPVIFRQRRPGLNSNPFTFIKFRTMSDTCDESGCLLPMNTA